MKNPQQKILLLGYGEMGHAMAYLLGPSCEISIHDPATGHTLDLEQTLPKMDVVIFCTPTAPIFDLARQISGKLSARCYCLSMGKALDAEGRTSAVALRLGLGPDKGFGVLYGPMIAEEILAGRPAFSTYAASTSHAFEKGLRLFEGSGLKLHAHTDAHGAAWCAVIKNIYAMLFGMADELGMGLNMRGFLCVACLREMSSLMVEIGGSPSTPNTLAGLGDLITTGTSEDSHHHSLGRAIARGNRDNLQGEGIATLEILARTRAFPLEDYPLIRIAREIIQRHADPRQALARYAETGF